MWLLVEDDYGLWEVAWRLGGVESATQVVERLCEGGLAEVYVREWVDAELIPLARSGYDFDLRDAACWSQPTADDPHLVLAATEAGRETITHTSSPAQRPEHE